MLAEPAAPYRYREGQKHLSLLQSVNRLYFGDNLGWLRNRDEFPNGASISFISLNSTHRVDAPPQLNPFAMAAREAAEQKQTEML